MEQPHITAEDFVRYLERRFDKPRQDFRVGRRVLLSYVAGLPGFVQDLSLAEAPTRLFRDPYYIRPVEPPVDITVMKGPIGAPAAVSAVEELVALGAQEIWVLGYSGSLQPPLTYGSLLIPNAAHVDEGTSGHYGRTGLAHPNADLLALLTRVAPDVPVGALWTTDAIYREMPSQIRRYQEQGVLGVDMETSALFHLGQHLGVSVGALMVVSDELFHAWNPGFGSEAVQQGCRRAYQVMAAVLTRRDGTA
ncbi:MAG: nucleoside phosphorylase [Thermaerobacter sp.]|nr:nucleoside phosphorylase [Thermaerobacter sp.]